MNLEMEIIELLKKAKDTGEYFNPRVIADILDIVAVTDENLIPDDVQEWASNMWGR